jgi:1-acyl-sn-glycerol-3-phosphate acyltransferase
VILAGNHINKLDVPIALSTAPRADANVIAAQHLTRKPIRRMLIPVFMSGMFVRPNMDFLEQATEVLRRGESLGMSPEGIPSRTGKLGPGHNGVAFLAARTGAPIVPFAMYGQEKVWRYALTLRRTPVRVVFGTPLHLRRTTGTKAELDAQTAQLMAAIASLLPAFYRS